MRKGRNGGTGKKQKTGEKNGKKKEKTDENSGHYVIARTPTAGTPHTRAKSGKVEKNGENSGPLLLLPVNGLNGDQLQR